MKQFPDTTKSISLIGLKSCSQEEILEMIEFYKKKGCKTCFLKWCIKHILKMERNSLTMVFLKWIDGGNIYYE